MSRLLSKIFERIENGSEDTIREMLDLALGIWTAENGAAHQILAVSESRVCFADQEGSLYVGCYTLTEDNKLRVSQVTTLCNVSEEEAKTAWLEEDCLSIVRAVREQREADVDVIVAQIVEDKTRVIRRKKLTMINKPATRRRNYMKLGASVRRRKERAAAITAKRTGWKSSKKVRQKASMARRELLKLPNQSKGPKKAAGWKKLGENINEVAQNLLHAITMERDMPFREVLIERPDEIHIVTMIEEGEEPVVVEAKSKEEGESKKDKFLEMIGKKGKKGEAKSEKKDDDDDDDDDKKDDKDDKKSDKKSDKKDCDESYIELDIGAVYENVAEDDHFLRSALSWGQFRDNPISESTAELLEGDEPDAEKVLNSCPWLGVCTKDEIYEAIGPHMPAFDPLVVREFCDSIVALSEGEDGQTARQEFLDAFHDEELKTLMEEDGRTISGELDKLFLEASKFSFGAADDLGNDNLDNDLDVEGMPSPEEEGTDGLPGEEDMSLDDTSTVEFSMSEDDAREQFMKILDVIGDEIQDNDEFDELRSKIEDEDSELEGDDVTSLLQVISDYFEATGRADARRAEKEDESEAEGESLEDMGGEAGLEGDQGAAPPAEEPMPVPR